MSKLEPNFGDVQAHYDLSDDFFTLFLDPSMTYSCAYFEREDMTLAEAQRAKIELSLGKCDLKPGMRLLDIGCGWGATARRAVEMYDVNAIGLTLSRNQQRTATERAKAAGLANVEYRLMGWEEFHEPVDRIVSIGAFEHFRLARFGAFFAKCRDLLNGAASPPGRMMLHTIVYGTEQTLEPGQTLMTHEHVLFAKFIQKEIFPGGQLTRASVIEQYAREAGFEVQRVHSLRLHYARTLTCWAENLAARKADAIALTSEEVYERYMKYLTGCAHYFRTGHLDVCQFTLIAPVPGS
ncbi:MAG: methyltransferase domain-containing protein [Planctomycetes bacterium]|nr:methyltransferase domain-containing protein [Planctomycetota bacterium]